MNSVAPTVSGHSPTRFRALTPDENELLCNTDRGTPGGDFLRSYWQPVALASDVDAGGAPVPLVVMGEELVLFRDTDGKYGLVGRWCPHRGVDLSYSRVEVGGLRCLYHGWLISGDGRCREQPGELEQDEYSAEVSHSGYPCVVAAGCVFAYLGDGEPPALPGYDVFAADPDHVFAARLLYTGNYTADIDHALDPGHVSFLHLQFPESEASGRYGPSGSLGITGTDMSANALYGLDPSPLVETERVDYGLRVAATRRVDDDRSFVRVMEYMYPNICTAPVFEDGYTIQYIVPQDNESHWRFDISLDRATAFDKERWAAIWGAMQDEHGHSHRRGDNRYRQDRDQMGDWFAGMGPFPPDHDGCVLEQTWPRRRRVEEQLGAQDRAIAQVRDLMVTAINDVAQGKPPPRGVQLPGHRVVAFSAVVDRSTKWNQLYDKREAALSPVTESNSTTTEGGGGRER
ncbi:Rieske 2Fe-2S domain-containing protein [Williamsia soli]|uniref:Rieske 2Fe-2S domain-containing protein n=1 Tax=Williamsia soli TaxID=364929 RepID=UPI001A9E46F8|nr:Rieske 2Fe-2S domain-containing protein [Williamsia soli]